LTPELQNIKTKTATSFAGNPERQKQKDQKKINLQALFPGHAFELQKPRDTEIKKCNKRIEN
jgi:hypothetical protein